MLTRLAVRNFKRFGEVDIELGNPVVFVGPNNSGKTSALQALALWEIGMKRWNEKRKGNPETGKTKGVTINRRDLIAVPVPMANLLWRDLHVRDVETRDGKPQTSNVRIDIVVDGVTQDRQWTCGFEFDYANEESLYCRPLRLSSEEKSRRMPVPSEAANVSLAFLPPMSGLAANETRLDPGAVNVRIGEGRTAEVLRNLCYRVATDNHELWKDLVARIRRLFGAELDSPRHIAERGEILMSYRERKTVLDLSSSGRGLQQTLLLLAYMYANRGAVLLVDEPDAHLEILRQRQIYQVLTEVASRNANQLIIASHSEVVLNEAAERDVVVAFVGRPHRINDRGHQALKALREIGYEQYYLAEQCGWVLYLEGSTDLAILRALARRLALDEAAKMLERPFVHYVGNQPAAVRKHFHGLRDAVPNLKGVALFDHLDRELPTDLGAEGLMWKRREIENYLCSPGTLQSYARHTGQLEAPGPLFAPHEALHRETVMQTVTEEISSAMAVLGRSSPWAADTKVSDEFLTPLFEKYFRALQLPNVMAKTNHHELAEYVPIEDIDPEVTEKLEAIVRVGRSATLQEP